MAEGKVPQTFGEKLVFGIPAILVAVALSVGIAYIIVANINSETRKQLDAMKIALEGKDKAHDEALAKTVEAQTGLDKKVADLSKSNTELKDRADKTAAVLEPLTPRVEKLTAELDSYREGQKNVDKIQTQDIAATVTNVSKIDQRVKYVEDKIQVIDRMQQDISGLKVDTGDLKAEGKKLRGELELVRNKADVTEVELADLGERTKQFQLRVLLARAREAAEQARKSDLQTLLQTLDDVEEKK